jgi:hypothetical protein
MHSMSYLYILFSPFYNTPTYHDYKNPSATHLGLGTFANMHFIIIFASSHVGNEGGEHVEF